MIQDKNAISFDNVKYTLSEIGKQKRRIKIEVRLSKLYLLSLGRVMRLSKKVME